MATQAVAAKIAFGGVIPVLRAANLDRSVEHCTQALGFQPDFRSPDFARCRPSLSRRPGQSRKLDLDLGCRGSDREVKWLI
jgi:hypothetical protein